MRLTSNSLSSPCRLKACLNTPGGGVFAFNKSPVSTNYTFALRLKIQSVCWGLFYFIFLKHWQLFLYPSSTYLSVVESKVDINTSEIFIAKIRSWWKWFRFSETGSHSIVRLPSELSDSPASVFKVLGLQGHTAIIPLQT